MTTATHTQVEVFKTQAKRLREFLQDGGIQIKHANALEAVAKMHGHQDFHALSATAARSRREAPGNRNGHPILDAVIGFAMFTKDNPVLHQDWEQWDVLRMQFDAGDENEWYPRDEQVAALLAARITLNRFDVDAMAAAVPWLATSGDGNGFAAYREGALRVLSYLDAVDAEFSAHDDAEFVATWQPKLGLPRVRYALHGCLACGYFDDDLYLEAAQHANRAWRALADGGEDPYGMRSAAVGLALRVGDFELAASAADPASEVGRVLAVLRGSDEPDCGDAVSKVLERARSPMSRSDFEAVVAWGDEGGPYLGHMTANLMDFFSSRPLDALAWQVKRSPPLQAKLQQLVAP